MSKVVASLDEAISLARHGQDSMCPCPSHQDSTASLHVTPGTTQPVLLKCHALCETVDIIAASGLDWAEVCAPLERPSPEVSEWTPRGTASHIYDYTDEEGALLFQTLRVPTTGGGKTFLQRHVGPDGRASWNLQGVRRVIYRLPAVLRAVHEGREVWVMEGEKDVDTALLDGLTATTSPMGAGKWSAEYSECFRGATVTIVADADEVGREHARAVAADLVRVECQVRIVESPLGKDYADHRRAGGVASELLETWRSEVRRETRRQYGFRTFIRTEFDSGTEIIPGYLAEANIVLLVGTEGSGKSLCMRQIAYQCAAGINPFTLNRMEPLRTLFIDAENPEHQQQLDWHRLDYIGTRMTGLPIGDEYLTLISTWEDAPSLIHPAGRSWLMERVNALQPQIVFMGPVSDLVDGKLADDDVARKFKRTVYDTRAICGSAFMIEHHAPHRMAGDKTREMRPYGSSIFQRWPDFGYGITPTDEEGVYKLHPFRGARVRSRAWPDRMRWGKANSAEWPWEFEPDISGSLSIVS